MPSARLGSKLVAGAAALAVVAAALPTTDLRARTRRRGRKARVLRLTSLNVARQADVALNSILEFRFTGRVAQSSVSHALFQIRGQNAARPAQARHRSRATDTVQV